MKKLNLLALGIFLVTTNAFGIGVHNLPISCVRQLPCAEGYRGGCWASSDSWVKCDYLRDQSGKIWGASCKGKSSDGQSTDRVETCKPIPKPEFIDAYSSTSSDSDESDN